MAANPNAPQPLSANRVLLPVTYLTSCGVSTAHCVAHFYLVAENEARLPPGKNPQKRLALIADRPTFQSDMDVSVSRCVSFSQITEISVQEDHLGPLIGPFSEYDILLQQSSIVDFIRTVSAVFKPNSTTSVVPTFVVEDGGISSRVLCRLSPNALQDVVGTAAQEATQRSLRTTKDREIQSMQEALGKQKEESLLEMVELHTHNETLKHSLSQTEQALMSTRRAAREEKDLLVAKLRQLEAERDAARGHPVRSPIGDQDPLYQPTPAHGNFSAVASAATHSHVPQSSFQQSPYNLTRSDQPLSVSGGMSPSALGQQQGGGGAYGQRPVGGSYSAQQQQQFGGSPAATAAAGGMSPPVAGGGFSNYGGGGTPVRGGGYGAPVSASPYGGATAAATPPSKINQTLDQLQNQLNDGERFLQGMRSGGRRSPQRF